MLVMIVQVEQASQHWSLEASSWGEAAAERRQSQPLLARMAQMYVATIAECRCYPILHSLLLKAKTGPVTHCPGSHESVLMVRASPHRLQVGI